jgi:tetratricopeptide (TPR) repeat protein
MRSQDNFRNLLWNMPLKKPRSIGRGLLLLVIFALLAVPLAAQSDQAAKRADAERLAKEGEQLYEQGTAESLEASGQKFAEALPLFRTLNDRSDEATTLAFLGLIYIRLGEPEKALDYLGQALPIARTVGAHDVEAVTLKSIGEVYDQLGEQEKALGYYGQALPLFHAIKESASEAVTLIRIGKIYSDLGEPERALDYFGQALLLFRAVKDRIGEATTLNDIGYIYIDLGQRQDDLGQKQKALDYFGQSLAIYREIGDRHGEAVALTNIGVVYDYLIEPKEALKYYEQTLPIFRAVGERSGEAKILSSIGKVYFELGEPEKALSSYEQALPIFQAVKDRHGEASALITIAYFERNRGNLSEALTRTEAALSIFESLRTGIANQELRSSFFASVQDHYEFYADLLMQLHNKQPTAGYDGKALYASERGRARVLLETLAEANADIRQGVDTGLLNRERTLQRQLNDSAQKQMQFLSGPHTEEQSKAIAQEIEALTTEFQRVEAQIRQTSPRYAALTQPQPLTLKEIQTQVLDADTLLLEYSLDKYRRSYLWAVTTDSITSYELPKRDEIEDSARHLYSLLNARNQRIKGETQAQRAERVAQADRDIPTAAASLSQMVLAPAAAQLGKKRLVIVADGMLQYIPFAVLPVPQAQGMGVGGQGLGNSKTNQSPAPNPQPLIVEHEIVSLPSASTLAVLRREVAGRKPAPKSVVALADPVFMKNDERVKSALNKSNGEAKAAPSTTPASQTTPAPTPTGSETVRELELVEAAEDTGVSSGGLYVPRLPGSRKEAEEIVAMVPATESRLALDFEASRDVATSAELSQYRYVHFSTHGFLNSVHPELSGIVFSLVNKRGEAQDGFLRAHEVFNLKLPVELVVLSACQTGIGKEVKGEGLVSLTRGFMYAGAPRVVVSLWSVNETGTAELMVRFYREMLKEGKPAAAALRAAQISLMKEARWQSPFYWAAFTIQGEWR